MSPIACFSRRAVHLHHSHSRILSSVCSSFSTCVSESAATASKPPPPPYTPPPVGVALTKDAGRAVFASKRFTPGELIHTAKPMISHPSLSMSDKVCYFCLGRLQKGDTSSEDFSQTVFFCSEQCEEESKAAAVTTIKDEVEAAIQEEKRTDPHSLRIFSGLIVTTEVLRCREEGKLVEIPSILPGLKYPLLVKRFACKAISGFIHSGIFEILQEENLCSNKISKMKEEFGLLRSTLEDSDIEREQMSFLTEEWYIGVLARIRINAFRVELPIGSYEDLHSSAAASVEAEAAVGNAIYMLPSFYNHSCDPNVNIVWSKNADAKIVALRDIEEEEELRICYLDASMGYEARQKILYQGYGFRCNCSRCVSKD